LRDLIVSVESPAEIEDREEEHDENGCSEGEFDERLSTPAMFPAHCEYCCIAVREIVIELGNLGNWINGVKVLLAITCTK